MVAVATPSTTSVQRQMMSRLCADAGAAVHMAYAQAGSGADPQLIPGALTVIFKFKNVLGYSITSPADDVTPLGTAALACSAIQAKIAITSSPTGPVVRK